MVTLFVILTPDEMAYTADQADLSESERNIELRARPNVIFEFGYFVGKLGRKRVCCVIYFRLKLNCPATLMAFLYKPFTQNIEESRLRNY